FVLVQHRRKKYRCACNGCIDTAPGPRRLTTRPDRRGRRYSPAFAVEVAVNKYVDHQPLERQARIMAREGLTIESQTLWDQLDAVATVLPPAYDALARAGPGVTLAHCWAHVRRKFVEAEPHYPEPCGAVLTLIGQLYAVERACPSLDAGVGDDLRAEALALRATARRAQSAAI